MLFLLIASLFIPQTNYDTLQTAPLDKGETAYVCNGDGTVTEYVGSSSGDPLYVADKSALRGVVEKEIDPAEISVVSVSNFTFNASSNRWETGARTFAQRHYGVLRISVPKKYNNPKLTYDYCSSKHDYFGYESVVKADETYVGDNVWLVSFSSGYRYIFVRNIGATFVTAGVRDTTNDLSKVDFTIKDRIGVYKLNDLRQWVTNSTAGNLGCDWSDYLPHNNLMMDKYAVNLGGRGTADDAFALSANLADTNTLYVTKGGRTALTIANGGTAYVPTGSEVFDAMPLSATNGVVRIQVTASGITGFSTNGLHVFASKEAHPYRATWKEVGFSLLSQSGNTYIIGTPTLDDKGYYRVSYDPQYIAIKAHGHLIADAIETDAFTVDTITADTIDADTITADTSTLGAATATSVTADSLQFKVGTSYTTIPTYVEYNLADKSGVAITLNSGEIGNLSLAANATATVNLVFPTTSGKAGDALLRVTASTGTSISTITVNGAACTVEQISDDALTPIQGVNYISFTRTAVVNGTPVVMVSRQPVVD